MPPNMHGPFLLALEFPFEDFTDVLRVQLAPIPREPGTGSAFSFTLRYETGAEYERRARGFRPQDLPRLEALGVTHVVLRPANRLPGPPLFENARYVVYTPSPALQSR